MVHHELLNHVTVAPESVLALYSSSNHPSSSQALPSLGFFLEHLLKGYFLLPCFRIYTEFPKSDAEVCIFTARLACQSFTVRTLRTTAILTKSRRIITMKNTHNFLTSGNQYKSMILQTLMCFTMFLRRFTMFHF